MKYLALIASVMVLAGCAGQTSRNPPLEVWPDMKRQPKYKNQRENDFFADRRDARPPVPGTVSREQVVDDETGRYTGVVNNQYIGRNPLPMTADLLKTGQMRFNTYCSPCHDQTGSGKGMVPQKTLWLPTNLHDDRVLKMNDGEIFNVISHGRRSMPPYRFQISVDDRWAIVSYVRALQRTITTTADVPPEMRAQLGAEGQTRPTTLASAGQAR